MDSRDAKLGTAVIVLAAIAVAIWMLPEQAPITGNMTGEGNYSWTSPWDDADTATVMASADAWLASERGQKIFPNAEAGEAVPVFDGNASLYLWIIPVKQGGNVTGYIMADEGEFTNPSGSMKYSEPKKYFINRDSAIDMHTYIMLKYGNGSYAPEQINEPYIVTKDGGGFFWVSEITKNDKVVDRIYIDITF
ncbi:MAG: hypothetical protein DRO99_05225 [Candidatus Aenigmatarchaeota archaeon]|nr:MAG: hypothetical protein DRO99_05225 [Candidatus Aenigmarchaeota archaeon]